MNRWMGWAVPGLLVLVLAALVPPRASAAPTWAAGLSGVSNSLAAGGAIGTPTSVTASCVSAVGSPITVTWSAVAKAAKYIVSQSVNGAAYTQAAIVTTNTWTSGANNTLGTYTYKIQAGSGTNWLGSQSAASNQRLIVVGLVCT